MDEKRLGKLTEVLKQELAFVISQEIDFPKGVIATVMSVRIFSDLSWAEIFVSVIPEKESEFVINVLRSHAYFLHKALNEKIRLRRIPRIKFLPYTGPNNQEKIEQILDEISAKESSAE